ncbi:MAG TPA: META domain-containing protein [Candidatus Limnocylindrales bacterium]|nr:META domain-containing protein [Candidatus Limnocylindrales bacterium]
MRLAVAILVWLVVTACAPEPAPTPIRGSHLATLATTRWTVVAIGGQAIAPRPEVLLGFDATTVAGSGGCNGFGGSYAYDPASGALRITDLVSTKRACGDPATGRAEAAYFEALRGAAVASVDPDGRLVIDGAGPELRLAVADQPLPVPTQSEAGPS